MTRDPLANAATGKSGSVLMGRALLYGEYFVRPSTATGVTLTIDTDPQVPALARIRYKATKSVVVEQQNQRVAVLAPTGATYEVAHLLYDPKLGAPVLRFTGAIDLDAPETMDTPVITTTPPTAPGDYQAGATSSVVTRWTVSGPATVDPWTGKVSITGPGRVELKARNDYGVAVQSFDVN